MDTFLPEVSSSNLRRTRRVCFHLIFAGSTTALPSFFRTKYFASIFQILLQGARAYFKIENHEFTWLSMMIFHDFSKKSYMLLQRTFFGNVEAFVKIKNILNFHKKKLKASKKKIRTWKNFKHFFLWNL